MFDAEILTVAIGLGLVISLLFSELFGLAAGGLVVPGYFAIFLHQPVLIATTIAAALVTHSVVRLLGSFFILYGKRRTVLVILVAYILRMTVDITLAEQLLSLMPDQDGATVVIGYIIPGLIALWFDRQGILETLTTLAAASAVVRIILILIYGNDFLP